MKFNIKKASLTFMSAASALAIAGVAQAGEAEDALIAKVVEAYGGDDLRNLKSIRIQDNYRTAFPGQGFTSGYVEFGPLKQYAHIDLDGERGSIENWGSNFNFTFNNRTVSAGDDIVNINYQSGDYQPAAFADFYAAFGVSFRVSDTLLAWQLAKGVENAEHQGERIYTGDAHEILSFEMPGSPPLTIYVNQETGLISKMARETGFGDLTYHFERHNTAGDIAYARDFEFFVGPDVNIVTLSRDVAFNSVRNNVFRIDSGIDEEPERVDTSEMTVDEIAPGVHHVGTGPGYTMFVDAGDHVIGVGGYAGLNDRWEAYREAAGHEKPLRYQIATHHHTDHLGGMAEAFALGATFVTTAGALENVHEAAGERIPDDRIMVLDGKMTLGPVEIHDITTNHVDSYAFVYAPTSKVGFQADHYPGTYVNEVSSAGVGTVSFAAAVNALGLDIETVMGAHGRKAVPWSEIEAAAAAYRPGSCLANRPICRDEPS